MVTINLAHSAPINPLGAHPVLTAAQAWAGLMHKARRPQDFVPVVSGCEILSEAETSIEAIVYFEPGVAHATTIRETCTLRAPSRLDYDMEDGSTATNIISLGSSGNPEDLILTFCFGWEHAGVEEGSQEAQDILSNHLNVLHGQKGSTIQ
ncbi:unnamed protein product [Parascedosporium putredinis]|uniref:DUF1857 family protein n=1 Tax=Parascedosporium putredinis TaxID=1442378 RepID=A0A9P1H4P6_9PEZI|nr:unnamed protein product [Parascedosporium putredinis]CAI7996177.1 unnamed protein product [Parascedosporium putredinis]